MLKILSGAAAVLSVVLISAVPAFAEEPAGSSKWSGIGLSIGGGLGSANHELDIQTIPPGLFSFNLDGLGGEGGFFTLGVSGDIQIAPRVVIGAFFDYDFASFDTDLNLNLGGALNIHANLEVEDQWTFGGRIGYLLTPQTLWYVLAGYTHVDTSDLDITLSDGVDSETASIGVPSFSGYVVGGGVETMFAPNWSLKAEYRYTELDDERLNLDTIAPGLNDFIDARLEPTIHTGRLAVSYKFNWDRREAAPAPLK